MPTNCHYNAKKYVVIMCIHYLDDGAAIVLRKTSRCFLAAVNTRQRGGVCRNPCALFVDHLLTDVANSDHEQRTTPHRHCNQWCDAAVFGPGH